MGLMDKMKASAEQALAKAQQGVAQGQARLDALQAKKAADALLRDLGAAYYAELRNGAPHEPVEAALAKVDAHVSEHGPIDTSATADVPAQPSSGEAPAGGFNLDDI